MYYMIIKVLIIDQESPAKVCWHSCKLLTLIFSLFFPEHRKRRTCDEGLISYTGRICWQKCRNFPSKCFHPVVASSSFLLAILLAPSRERGRIVHPDRRDSLRGGLRMPDAVRRRFIKKTTHPFFAI